MADTQPGVVEEVETQTRTALPWNVIVHNDPISLDVYVTMVFQKIFGYPFAKAHTLMMEVHTTGRSVVWSGSRERAEVYVSKLHAYHLLATLEHTEA